MTEPRLMQAAAVLQFWFSAAVRPYWFQQSDAIDREIHQRFNHLHQRAAGGELHAWKDSPEGALALVILLDQFSRNIYRGVSSAYACDAQALTYAKEALERRFDHTVPYEQRQFFYLPFMHSEDLAEQQRSLELYRRYGDAHTLAFAQEHYTIITRFGRFPHRNTALKRLSTEAEKAFIQWHKGF